MTLRRIGSVIAAYLSESDVDDDDAARQRAEPTDCPAYHDEAWLREQYADEGRTMEDIAEAQDTSTTTIHRWLKKHNIPTRKRGTGAPGSKYRDEAWLREQYVEHGRSLSEMADASDVTAPTISHWLKKHNIPVRSPNGWGGGEGE